MVITPNPASLAIAGVSPRLDLGIAPGAGGIHSTDRITFEPDSDDLLFTSQVDSFITPDAVVGTLTLSVPAIDRGMTPLVASLAFTATAPSLNLTITPDSVALTAVGVAPNVSGISKFFTPLISPLALSTTIANIEVPITVPAATLVLTTRINRPITTVVGSAVLTTTAPTLNLTVNVPVATALAISSDAPDVSAFRYYPPGALSLSTLAPTLNLTVNVPVRNLVISTAAPKLGSELIPFVASLNINFGKIIIYEDNGLTPIYEENGVVPIYEELLGVTGLPPTVTSTTNTFIPVATKSSNLATTVPGLAFTLNYFLNLPTSNPLTVVGNPFAIASTITPIVGSIAFSGAAPTVRVNSLPNPVVGSLALSTTTVFASQAITLPTLVGSIAFAQSTPNVSQNLLYVPTSQSLAIASAAPTIDLKILPASQALALTGVAPIVTASILVNLFPIVGTLALAGSSPSIIIAVNLTPNTRDLVLETEFVFPTINSSKLFALGAAPNLVLTGVAPIAFALSSQSRTPLVGSLALGMTTPQISQTLNQYPVSSSGSLTLGRTLPIISKTVSNFVATSDTLNILSIESRNLAITLSRSDTLSVHANESRRTLTTVSTSDQLRVASTESHTTPFRVLLGRSDTLRLAWHETVPDLGGIKIRVRDNCFITLKASSRNLLLTRRSDQDSIKFVDTSHNSNVIFKTDIAGIAVQDAGSYAVWAGNFGQNEPSLGQDHILIDVDEISAKQERFTLVDQELILVSEFARLIKVTNVQRQNVTVEVNIETPVSEVEIV